MEKLITLEQNRPTTTKIAATRNRNFLLAHPVQCYIHICTPLQKSMPRSKLLLMSESASIFYYYMSKHKPKHKVHKPNLRP